MDIETLRNYCLNKPNVIESLPFDDVTLVFKVYGKIFAILPLDVPVSIALKCNPEYAVELREQYAGIMPGYHLNKIHWNQVSIVEDVDDALLQSLIDLSYNLVLAKVPKRLKL